MVFTARWSALILFASAVASVGQPATPVAIEKVREDLGIGRYTAPSIEEVFQYLAVLGTVPFDKVWRPLPEHLPQDRPRMALLSGALIADGFLVVSAERANKLEPVGHGLVRLAKGLGIGERLTKRGRHILEMADHDRWNDIHRELVKTQAEAEAALLALKDDEIVHLLALGGWLRGLEITSATVVDNYSPERASRLFQPDLADSFLDRIHTFHPRLRNSALMQLVEKDLRAIRDLVPEKGHERPFTLTEVKRIHELTRDADRAICSGE